MLPQAGGGRKRVSLGGRLRYVTQLGKRLVRV
jgi:hypothetical protein